LGISVKPHLVLEQSVEKDSPKTMDAAAAHRRGGEYARKVFAGFAA
jgi:inosose dehydratase